MNKQSKEPTKNDKLTEIMRFMNQEGMSIEDLKTFQSNQHETESAPEIRPSELDGVSNDPALSNSQLTARLVELERRFNNLAATVGV